MIYCVICPSNSSQGVDKSKALHDALTPVWIIVTFADVRLNCVQATAGFFYPCHERPHASVITITQKPNKHQRFNAFENGVDQN